MAEITELRHLLYFRQRLWENGSWYSDALGRQILCEVGNCVIEKET